MCVIPRPGVILFHDIFICQEHLNRNYCMGAPLQVFPRGLKWKPITPREKGEMLFHILSTKCNSKEHFSEIRSIKKLYLVNLIRSIRPNRYSFLMHCVNKIIDSESVNNFFSQHPDLINPIYHWHFLRIFKVNFCKRWLCVSSSVKRLGIKVAPKAL